MLYLILGVLVIVLLVALFSAKKAQLERERQSTVNRAIKKVATNKCCEIELPNHKLFHESRSNRKDNEPNNTSSTDDFTHTMLMHASLSDSDHSSHSYDSHSSGCDTHFDSGGGFDGGGDCGGGD